MNPLDELKKRTKELEEQNKKVAKIIESPLKTIRALTQAAENRSFKVKNEQGQMEWKSTGRAALRSLIRPPAVLTAQAFVKPEEKPIKSEDKILCDFCGEEKPTEEVETSSGYDQAICESCKEHYE